MSYLKQIIHYRYKLIIVSFILSISMACASDASKADYPSLYDGQVIMAKEVDSLICNNYFNVDGSHRLTIGHCSDVHAGNLNWKENLSEFLTFFQRKKIKSKINVLINTGDLSNGDEQSSKKKTLSEIRSVTNMFVNQDIPSLAIVGNHDINPNFLLDQNLSNQEKYDEIIKPLLDKFFPEQSSLRTYYNINFTEFKIKIIFVDFVDYSPLIDQGDNKRRFGGYYFSQAQLEWLYENLYNTPKDWGVIIAIHGLPKETIKLGAYNQGTQLLPDVINAFKHGKRFQHQWNGGNYPDLATKVDFDFRQKGESEFICWIAGHIHGRYYTTADNYPDQVMLTTPCIYTMNIEEFFHNNRPYALERSSNTTTQNSFNILEIDRKMKKIYITAYGAYLDYYGSITDRTTIINY